MNLLICKICGFEGKSLITHLKFKHSLTVCNYRKKYGNCKVYIHSDEHKNKISNTLKKFNDNQTQKQKNSDRQKNGGSCFTIKYWTNRGFTEKDAKRKISELQKNNSIKHLEKNDLQECSHFSKKFWIKKGYSEEEAKCKISELQSELSSRSSKFLGHKRTENEKEKISSSMKKMIDRVGRIKWASHFEEFNGRSKAETMFFNYIRENIDGKILANVIIGNYVVGILKKNKIIEFYGDFWHANPNIFSKYEKLYPLGRSGMIVEEIWRKDDFRIKSLKNMGYDVLIIWESEWNKSRVNCINKIKKYLL